MSKNDIKLSPKYGLNPSMQICFFCREPKGILLNGKIGKGEEDIEASREVITDIEPCDKCKEKYKECTLVVEVLENEQPSGRWIAIKKKFITEKEIRNSHIALATEDTFSTIINREGI